MTRNNHTPPEINTMKQQIVQRTTPSVVQTVRVIISVFNQSHISHCSAAEYLYGE